MRWLQDILDPPDLVRENALRAQQERPRRDLLDYVLTYVLDSPARMLVVGFGLLLVGLLVPLVVQYWTGVEISGYDRLSIGLQTGFIIAAGLCLVGVAAVCGLARIVGRWRHPSDHG